MPYFQNEKKNLLNDLMFVSFSYNHETAVKRTNPCVQPSLKLMRSKIPELV